MTDEQQEFMRMTEDLLTPNKVLAYANLARLGGNDPPSREVYERIVRMTGGPCLNAHYPFSPHDIHKRVVDWVMGNGQPIVTACIEPTKTKWTLLEQDYTANPGPVMSFDRLFAFQSFWRQCLFELDLPKNLLLDHSNAEWVNTTEPTARKFIELFSNPFLLYPPEGGILFGTCVGGSLPPGAQTKWKSIDVYDFSKANERIGRLLQENARYKLALWIDCMTLGNEAESFGCMCRHRHDAEQIDQFIMYPHPLYLGTVNGAEHNELHLVRFGQWLKGFCSQ